MAELQCQEFAAPCWTPRRTVAQFNDLLYFSFSVSLSLCSFYSSPYSLAPNRMIAQTSLSPYMHSPVSSYQVGSCLSFKLDLFL